tara:strand:- start:766 stop:927 length:162 start_codon:yes stop_codon:yes gene_type:complete
MNKELSNLFTNAIDMNAVDKLSKNDLDLLCKALGIKKEEYLEKENQNKKAATN